MKRIASVFLSFLMLLCCVIPASATGLDSSQEGNVIDITPYVSPSYLNTSSISVGSSYSFDFDIDQILNAKYLTVILRTDDLNPRFISSSSSLTTKHIDSDLYIVYGTGSVSFGDDLSFSYIKGNSGSYLEILSFEVSQTDYITDNINFSVNFQGNYTYRDYTLGDPDQAFSVVNSSFNDTVSISVGDYAYAPLLHQNINNSSLSYNEQQVFVTSFLYFDWTKFDRVDLVLWNGFDELYDYIFYVDGVNVVRNVFPVILSGEHATMISLDFSDLDPNINTNLCYLRFRGYETLNSSTQHSLFQVLKLSCFTRTVSDNFWPAWLTKIIDKLDNIFTGREEDQAGANSFNDSINEQSNELEDLTADLNSVTRPPLSDVDLSTSNLVDQSVVVLATSGIGSILNNQIILRVLIMSLTFALAGFILFGKR